MSPDLRFILAAVCLVVWVAQRLAIWRAAKREDWYQEGNVR